MTPDRSFYVGLDLGQVQDYSAVAIAEAKKGAGGLRTYDVLHLHRWTLGTGYPEIVDELGELLKKLPGSASVIVDETGVGRAVLGMVRKAKLQARAVVGITITGGQSVHTAPGGWHVAKRQLVSATQACLQGRRLQVSPKLAHAKVLMRELETFKVKINIDTIAESFEAWRERDHDDLVLAVALVCWFGERAQRQLVVFA
jgi:hypothetical protein